MQQTGTCFLIFPGVCVLAILNHDSAGMLAVQTAFSMQEQFAGETSEQAKQCNPCKDSANPMLIILVSRDAIQWPQSSDEMGMNKHFKKKNNRNAKCHAVFHKNMLVFCVPFLVSTPPLIFSFCGCAFVPSVPGTLRNETTSA